MSSAFVPTLPATRSSVTPRATVSLVRATGAASARVAQRPARTAVPVTCPAGAPVASDFWGNPPARGAGPRRVVVWHLADLRSADNPALAAAARAAAAPGGALVPVAVSLAQKRAKFAAGLRDDLAARGSGLVALRDPQALVQMCRRLAIDAVFFNRAVAKEDVKMQKSVCAMLSKAGVEVRAFWGNVLRKPMDEDLTAKEGKIGIAKMYASKAEVEEPAAAPERLPRLPEDAAGMGVDHVFAKVAPCKLPAVLQSLKAVCTKESERRANSRGANAALVLKEFLDSGALSPKMVAAHIKEVVGSLGGKSFGELVWRDFTSLSSHRATGLKSAAEKVSA